LYILAKTASSNRLQDFATIAAHCPLLDSLSVARFRVDQPRDTLPASPAKFNFLTSLRLSDLEVENCGREFFIFVLGGCPELENLVVSFRTRCQFYV
jgi:hypothetical protein